MSKQDLSKNLDILEKELEEVDAKADLEGEVCHLKHSIHDPNSNHPATNMIRQYFGHSLNDVEVEADYEIRIPICDECVEALHDNDWVVFYCITCNESQWVYKPLALKVYPEGEHILWLDECPNCKVKN